MPRANSNVCISDGCQNPANLKCPKCEKLGRVSLFCSQDCFKESWPVHKETHFQPEIPSIPDVTSTAAQVAHAKETMDKIRQFAAQAAVIPALTDEQTRKWDSKLDGPAGKVRVSLRHPDALTPNTMMRFETPRLVIRSVKPEDSAWLYSVKGDARVNRYQLYGQPDPIEAKSFGNGYIRDRIPFLTGRRGGRVERARYVFAITPKAAQIPMPSSSAIPRVEGFPPHPPLPHEDDVYIGNIAFEIKSFSGILEGYPGFRGPRVLSIPGDDIFVWPDVDSDVARAELDEWAAQLFYEIAPQYWGQGLMNEAMLAFSDFIFCELGLGHMIVDPLTGNTASISLAKKFPDMNYVSTVPSVGGYDLEQHIFSVSRADYLKQFGRPLMTPMTGKKVCSYCINPRAHVRGEGETCSQCKKRWYCSQECRAVDWEAAEGHGARCQP